MQVTATASSFGLQSNYRDKAWTTATASVAFALNLPSGAVVDSAVLSFRASSPACGGSSLTADGQRTGVGTKAINISVDNGAQSRTVTFSFSGSGTGYTVSALTISDLALAVTYHVDSSAPFVRGIDGIQVKYKLYRGIDGILVPYDVYRGIDGILVKY